MFSVVFLGKGTVLHLLFFSMLYTVISFISTGKSKERKFYIQVSVAICYLLSLFLICLNSVHSVYAFWMVGGWLLCCLVTPYVGMICQIWFCLWNVLLIGGTLEEFSLQLLVSAGLCFLMPYLRKLSNMGYVILIGLFGNGIIIMLRQDWNFKKILGWSSLFWEGSLFLAILFSAVLSWLLQGMIRTGNLKFIRNGMASFFQSEKVVWQEGTFVKLGDLAAERMVEKQDKKLVPFLQKDFTLLLRLQQELPQVYRHSVQVAGVAKGAAKVLGIDQQFIYAGGLYHEIGRLEGDNYIKAGIDLLKKYQAPGELLTMVEEHNVSNRFPTSPETAVLMFTDSVVTMIERLPKATEKKKKVELTKKVFQLRLEQGALENSQLTLKQFRLLQQYFLEWLTKRE